MIKLYIGIFYMLSFFELIFSINRTNRPYFRQGGLMVKRCIVISSMPAFIHSIQESTRLALDEWSLTVVKSWSACLKYLNQNQYDVVLVDMQMSNGLPKSIQEVSEEYSKTWFLAVGTREYPGCIHVEMPLQSNSLTFFLQHPREDKPINHPIQDQQFLSSIYPILLNHLWSGLLNHWVMSDRTMIAMAAKNMYMPNLENIHLLPILIKTVNTARTEASREEASKDHLYFMDLFTRILLKNEHAGSVLDRFSQKWAVLLYIDQFPCALTQLYARCANITQLAEQNKWQCSFFIGEEILPEELLSQWERLDQLSESDVGYDAKILCLCNSMDSKEEATACPDMKVWKTMLAQEQWDAVREDMAEYLVCLAQCNRINVQWLKTFRDEFLKMICEVFQILGIPAAKILSEPLAGEEFNRSVSNVQIMIGWIGRILDNLSSFMVTEKADTVVKRTQKFILQNLDKTLTRDTIAAHVFVSSGYLAKIFKKEVGMTLLEYIYTERMALAAKLLEQTNLSITDIAMNAGFSNFSYFSTQFKKYSGFSPTEYRRYKRDLGSSEI